MITKIERILKRSSKIERWLGIGFFILGILNLITSNIILEAIPISYVMFLLFIVLGIYCILISPQIASASRKIELGILLASAIFFFGSFYVSYITNVLLIKNEYSTIYFNSPCPNNLSSENNYFNLTIFNSNLDKGLPVKIKFIGKNICVNLGTTCQEKWLTNPIIILPASNQTLIYNFNRTSNKPSQFYIETQNNLGWKLFTSPICKYK